LGGKEGKGTEVVKVSSGNDESLFIIPTQQNNYTGKRKRND